MKILLICLDNLGDLVFASSLIQPLHKKFPDAEWMILCKEYAKDIAKCFPIPIQVQAADPWWDNSPGKGKGKFWKFFKKVSTCRAWKPDIAITTSNNWRGAAIAFLLGAKKRIGFDRKKSRIFLTDVVSCEDWFLTPVTTMLRRLLLPLNISLENSDPPLCQLNAPTKINLSVNLDESFILFHPFAGDLKRCWPIENWISLANEIQKHGFKIVWMGRKDEVSYLESQVKKTKNIFLYPIVADRLENTLYITSKAICLIGHDSGPIHFAAAMNVPVIGLYLPGEYPRTVSQGLAKHQIIYKKNPREFSKDEVLKVFLDFKQTNFSIAKN